MCLYPKLIKNRKYTSTKKNGGNIPGIPDARCKYVPVGCGNCMECRKQKANEWRVRLLEDVKTHKNGKFITLTFSDEWIAKIVNGYKNENGQFIEGIKTLEGYALDNEIATRAMRSFLERWRKKYTTSVRHWMVTELGHNGTENIHLHGIIWTDRLDQIEAIWKHGFVWKGYTINGKLVNYVNEQTVNYIVKYITKIDEKHTQYKSKILTSGGIGKRYTETANAILNKYDDKQTIETYRTRLGHKVALPVYWRNKIYTEEEREKLWLQKLDKEERWVNGEKISIKGDEKEYYKSLKYNQRLNKELGYGTDEKDWTKQQYERERRTLMIKTRIAKAERKALRGLLAGEAG